MVNRLTDRRAWSGRCSGFDSRVSFYTSTKVGLDIRLTRLCRSASYRFIHTGIGRPDVSTNISASNTGSSSSSATSSRKGSPRLGGLRNSRGRLGTLVVQGVLVAKDPFTNNILHLSSVFGQTSKSDI